MRRGYGCLITNLLTFMVILATAASCALTVIIFANPAISINQFPPPTLPSIAVLASPTATGVVNTFPTFPATFTHTSTITFTPTTTKTSRPVTPTDTRVPITDTLEASATIDATQVAQLTENVATNTPPPTNTLAPSLTPSKTRSAFPFTVQGGSPTPIQNFANSSGCNWLGIAGQAFSLDGNPIINLVVHMEGGGLNQDAITGSKTAYGAGGYEFFLNNRPIQTTGEFKVQLRDQNGNVPLSDMIEVDTFADCSKNLLLINFVQNH